MPNPQISVIVPVYNAEKYLHRCIDSILAQTYTDFELILINDGSKDSSGKISDEYASKDSRIRVFHKGNGGVSMARNLGLDKARGEFITFVDSDDWISREYLEKLVIPFDQNDVDLSVCSFNVEGNKCGDFSSKLPNGKFTGNALRDLILEFGCCAEFSATWCKVYKKSLIDNKKLRFKVNIDTREDTIFFLGYLSELDSVYTSSDKLYHYVAFNGLSMDKHNNLNQLSQILDIYSKFEKSLNRFNFPERFILELMTPPVWTGLGSLQKLVPSKESLSLSKNFMNDENVLRVLYNTPPIQEYAIY